MKSLMSVDIVIFVVFCTAAISSFSNAELEQAKNRRANGAVGLVAFPRVGRSEANMNSNNNNNNNNMNNLQDVDAYDSFDNLPTNSFDEYEVEFPKGEMKRSSLIAFPRIGRNDAEMRKWARLMAIQRAMDKRAGPSAASGLWFGPRLGKRSINSNPQKNLY